MKMYPWLGVRVKIGPLVDTANGLIWYGIVVVQLVKVAPLSAPHANILSATWPSCMSGTNPGLVWSLTSSQRNRGRAARL